MESKLKILAVLVCLCATTLFAANEIQVKYTTGQTLYSIVMDSDTLKVWDGDSFETTPAAWTDCDIAMTEHSFVKGFYTGNFPSTAPIGRYIVFTYIGPAAADTDTMVKVDYYNWSGTSETTLGYVATILDSTYLNVGGIGSIVDGVKAKTDLLNFTGTGASAKVNSQIKATDDIAFSATQLTSIANAFVSDDAEAIRDLILGGDKTPITMVNGKARALVGAVAN